MTRRPGREVKLSAEDLDKLYAARGSFGREVAEKLGLRIPFDVYFEDPMVAAQDAELAFDDKCFVDWEPGFGDGPTSARFAVVDYDADTNRLEAPAQWDAAARTYLDQGVKLDRKQFDNPRFHQVNVWAILQRALRFFEEPLGLGRRIPWAFEGNRLLVVPHAGYGQNAYYDRQSKSLQFYYFERGGRRIQTCLSTDVIHHEFGHAVLDGVRPLLHESAAIETAAFHEFLGDLTAVLLALRNNAFRNKLVEKSKGDLAAAEHLSAIAQEFGREVQDKPYLRSAANKLTMADLAGTSSPHELSQVMTGAMFDILLALSAHYVGERGMTAPEAFWNTIQRMQPTALQPLDLLPPVDVTFRDYAFAVLRTQELANPLDPHGYRKSMLDAFVARGILGEADVKELLAPRYLHEKLELDVFHDVEAIASSKAAAYRFLDDNRHALGLPRNRDVIVADLYTNSQYSRQAIRRPRQTVLTYVWREEVGLEGRRFGALGGQSASLPCGGTLVFDEGGNVLSWAHKPGGEAGTVRRERLLDELEKRLAAGQVGTAPASARGMLGTRVPPFTLRSVDGTLRVELAPHLGLSEDHGSEEGGRQWELSS